VSLPDLSENSSLCHDGSRWWRDLVYCSDEQFAAIRERQIAKWLRFTKLTRILYHSFPEQLDEGKIDDVALLRVHEGKEKTVASFNTKITSLHLPHHVGEEVSPVVIELLARFFTRKDWPVAAVREELKRRLDYISDDRMYVNVAYGLSGLAPRTGDANAWNEHERLYSFALYVDIPGADGFDSLGGWAYDPAFTKQLMQVHGLDRWRGLGTRSGYTVYSNVYLGYGWFFNNIVAPNHVPYVYGRMLVLALFYQASLRYYQRRVTLATPEVLEQEIPYRGSALKETRRQFIEFTNNYWFREITSQIQGREIFARQIAALELEKEYDLVKDEMERADEFLETNFQSRLNWRMAIVAGGGAALAIISIMLTSMQINRETIDWTIFGAAVVVTIIVVIVGMIMWKRHWIDRP
jgi:hypothetical protein